jgi:hypothetical protein
MDSLIKIICANTEQERDAARDAAREALAKRNAAAPSDWEVVAAFLKDCTTLDGKPLALDEQGKIVTLNS